MKFKAVIFDLDGTLLDTLEDLKNAVNFALMGCGFKERSTDEVRAFIGNGVRVLISRAVPAGTSDEEYEKCFSLFRRHYLLHMTDNTAPFEKIMWLLDELSLCGIKTAVVSNKLDEAVKDLCKTQFGSLISFSKGVSDESERKPSPKNVLHIARKFGMKNNECLYVGDSEVDIKTAQNAQMESCGVLWGYRDENTLKNAGATFIAKSPDELLKIIKGE